VAPESKPRSFLYDVGTISKIENFSFFRLATLGIILLVTIFLKEDVLGTMTIIQIYGAIGLTFGFAAIFNIYWDKTIQIEYFIPSQLLYDLLLASYLIFVTGINESIFLFSYLLNIVLASFIYQLNGALVVATLSGLVYAIIFYINKDTNNNNQLYTLAYNELLFLLTALLCGQLLDELKKQNNLLISKEADINKLKILNDRLLNSIPVGILLIDSNENITHINKQAMELLENSKLSGSISKKISELLPSLEGILAIWDAMPEAKRLRYKFKHKISADKIKLFSLQVTPLPADPAESNTNAQKIIIFQDVSKITELEHRLEAETRLASVGQLAAGIAHEIRNPLASISGSIETLHSNLKTPSSEDKKLINIALREIKRLNMLITEFLQFAKPKVENFLYNDLGKIITEVTEAIQIRTKDMVQCNFIIDIPHDLRVYSDSEQLKQVFFNLFINSVEAAKDKHIQIKIAATQNTNGALLYIQDNGAGIPVELSKKIFDPFYSTKSYGTGLGLSTVAQILKSHKGTIRTLPSTEGATFEIFLPKDSEATL
jgi:two-component system, NtrC family, sensor histidine kinase PilS